MRWNRFLTPGRVIAAGFAFLILAGTGLLLLPISHQPGQSLSFMDALFTATSGVCITGLSSIQCNAVLSGFGQAVLLLLIQVGGMGITTLGVGIILVTGKKIGIRERTLIKESLNQPSFQGILRLLKVIIRWESRSGAAWSIPFRRLTMPGSICSAAAVFRTTGTMSLCCC